MHVNDPDGQTVGKRLEALLEPFPLSAISRLPRSTCRACSDSQRKRCDNHQWVSNCSECGGHHSSAAIHLDYVGHADVTRRLIEVDPMWSWEPVAWDERGLPVLDPDGGMWIRLTIHGVTRLGYGDAQGKRGNNAVKERIGDALRNAAMRFGVAIDLWSKSDAAEERKAAGGHHDDTEAPDPDTLAKMGAEVLAEAAAAIGDRPVLLPLYQRVTATEGLGDWPIPEGPHAGKTLGEFIVWAGQQTPPETGDPAVVDCDATHADGRPCVKPAGHDGNHRYATLEEAMA